MPLLLRKKLPFVLVGVLLFTACKDEYSYEGRPKQNQPPIANAGRDTVLMLPVDSLLLDGSASRDPDGTITTWNWKRVQGPTSGAITNETSAKTNLNGLTSGTYLFELTVTDNGGLSSQDTVQLMVQSARLSFDCNTANRATTLIQLTPIASIPTPRSFITAATIGNKLLLAGGGTQTQNMVSIVDIYDFSTQRWATAQLSIPRQFMRSATVGTKIFFAGGDQPHLPDSGISATTRVDIYDAPTNTWSSTDLPSPTAYASIAAVGNKVFFATDRVPFGTIDIYDLSTGSWSTLNLSVQRYLAPATAVGNKVYFAGGNVNGAPSATIDIYDAAAGTWSTSTLSQPTWGMASIYVNGQIYWAGGIIGYNATIDNAISTCKVEIRDGSTQSSSFTNLSQSKEFTLNNNQPIYYSGKIIFWEYGYLDIYDPQSHTWSIAQFPQNVFVESLALVNNTLYAVGYNLGSPDNTLSDQIWKLQY